MAGKQKKSDFETNLAKLEKLVSEMESGELSLDKSLQAFEEGIGIVRNCQQALADAEQKVEMLTSDTTEKNIGDLENDQ